MQFQKKMSKLRNLSILYVQKSYIDKNEKLVKNFPSIYENPDDLKRVAMLDENEEEKKSSDSHCLFGAKRAEPNHYEDY